MDDGHDFHRVRLLSIDDAVMPHDSLAQVGRLHFGDDAAGFRKLCDGIREGEDAPGEGAGVFLRVPRDVLADGLQVVRRLGGPDQLSHF